MSAVDRMIRERSFPLTSSPASVSLCSVFWPLSFSTASRKLIPVLLADEADHVAAGVAAEAVVKVGLGIDGKGRGLLLVEGTEADVVGCPSS